MSRIRYKLAYIFMDWGLRLIPNPYIRARFEMAVGIAADTIEFERNKGELDHELEGGT